MKTQAAEQVTLGTTWSSIKATELTGTNTTRLRYMIDHRGLCLCSAGRYVAQKQQRWRWYSGRHWRHRTSLTWRTLGPCITCRLCHHALHIADNWSVTLCLPGAMFYTCAWSPWRPVWDIHHKSWWSLVANGSVGCPLIYQTLFTLT